MKRYLFSLILLSLLLLLPLEVYGKSEVITIDTESLGKGIVSVSYEGNSEKKLKVLITKGTEKYTYNLRTDGVKETFPLQMGDGEYKIAVLENVTGTKYAFLKQQAVTLKLENPDVVYLNSIQNIQWQEDFQAVKKAVDLVGSEKLSGKILELVYNYVIKNYSYDYEKINQLGSDYLPDIEKTYVDKKGICYDYAALLASMQRSQAVPTRLVMGYAKGVEGYHAWNEIKVNGEWVVVDATFDAALWGGKAQYTMAKNPKDYQVVKIY